MELYPSKELENHGTLPPIQIVIPDSFADSRRSLVCGFVQNSRSTWKKVGFANTENQHGELPAPQTPNKESLTAILRRSLRAHSLKQTKHVRCHGAAQAMGRCRRHSAKPRAAPKTFFQ
jgi:hypothetical protein